MVVHAQHGWVRGQEEEALMDEGSMALPQGLQEVGVVLWFNFLQQVSHIPTRTLTLHWHSEGPGNSCFHTQD